MGISPVSQYTRKRHANPYPVNQPQSFQFAPQFQPMHFGPQAQPESVQGFGYEQREQMNPMMGPQIMPPRSSAKVAPEVAPPIPMPLAPPMTAQRKIYDAIRRKYGR